MITPTAAARRRQVGTVCKTRPREDTTSEQDRDFYLRLNADEFLHVAHDPWLVSGASYRGRYEDPPGTARRRVRRFHPEDGSQSVVLHADQLEPDVYPWMRPDTQGAAKDLAPESDPAALARQAARSWEDDGGQ